MLQFFAAWAVPGLAEQSQLRGKRKNVVSLESIREGTEEEVHVGNHPQIRFYVHWKEQMISIKFSSISPSDDTSTLVANWIKRPLLYL